MTVIFASRKFSRIYRSTEYYPGSWQCRQGRQCRHTVPPVPPPPPVQHGRPRRHLWLHGRPWQHAPLAAPLAAWAALAAIPGSWILVYIQRGHFQIFVALRREQMIHCQNLGIVTCQAHPVLVKSG